MVVLSICANNPRAFSQGCSRTFEFTTYFQGSDAAEDLSQKTCYRATLDDSGVVTHDLWGQQRGVVFHLRPLRLSSQTMDEIHSNFGRIFFEKMPDVIGEASPKSFLYSLAVRAGTSEKRVFLYYNQERKQKVGTMEVTFMSFWNTFRSGEKDAVTLATYDPTLVPMMIGRSEHEAREAFKSFLRIPGGAVPAWK